MTGLSSGEESLGLVWIVTAADNQMTQNGEVGCQRLSPQLSGSLAKRGTVVAMDMWRE